MDDPASGIYTPHSEDGKIRVNMVQLTQPLYDKFTAIGLGHLTPRTLDPPGRPVARHNAADQALRHRRLRHASAGFKNGPRNRPQTAAILPVAGAMITFWSRSRPLRQLSDAPSSAPPFARPPELRVTLRSEKVTACKWVDLIGCADDPPLPMILRCRRLKGFPLVHKFAIASVYRACGNR